jgi:hypothetical protein
MDLRVTDHAAAAPLPSPIRPRPESGNAFTRTVAAGGRAVVGIARAMVNTFTGGVAPVAIRALEGAATQSAAPALGAAAAGGETLSEVDRLKQLNEESRQLNFELLELQQEVEADNRHFSTLSNVLKARHETARAAISNIRS